MNPRADVEGMGTTMTDPRRNAEAGDHSDPGSPPRTPRWVKVAAAVVGALVLIFILLQLLGVGGQHGPGRHTLGDIPRPVSVVQPSPADKGVA